MFLEVFFTAPHGTTLGYEYNEKCEAIPLLEDYEYSSIPEEYKNRLAELHQGAMDFYHSYPLDMKQYGSIDAGLVMTNFIQFVLHPDDEDVAYWGPYPVYIDSFEPVSYTHLDVYKRQRLYIKKKSLFTIAMSWYEKIRIYI